jgi:hypothetical protein
MTRTNFVSLATRPIAVVFLSVFLAGPAAAEGKKSEPSRTSAAVVLGGIAAAVGAVGASIAHEPSKKGGGTVRKPRPCSCSDYRPPKRSGHYRRYRPRHRD